RRDLRGLDDGARHQARACRPVVPGSRRGDGDRAQPLPHLRTPGGDGEQLPGAAPRVGGLDVPRPLGGIDRAGRAGGGSGATVLTAIVAGNEIVARAGEFLTDVLHTGNALAIHQLELPLLAAKLLGLEPDGLRDASGIACTQPQVTSIPAWTADAKGLLTGAPAHAAVLAAQLAAQGLTGRRDLLESPLGYFYRVADIASPRRLARAVQDLGTDWRFARQYFNKRYPTDGFQLPAVHATLNVRRQLIDAGVAAAALPAVVERIFARIPFVMASSATMFSEG